MKKSKKNSSATYDGIPHYIHSKRKQLLNAMTLAMRLTNSVLSQLRSALRIQQVYILTDSEIVLSWIRTKPLKKVGTMIFNRLIEIGNITNHLERQNIQVCFGIPSKLNPADSATRIIQAGTTRSFLVERTRYTL
ncbi:hypothetical protein GCK32_006383 [Trichostrongylus colubriformis]|uniref:Uncharacterized protein n=1 Tax=Trichostrongylus colubriformis TaxID=6319 RepID=A0AAN8FMN1_TRICO